MKPVLLDEAGLFERAEKAERERDEALAKLDEARREAERMRNAFEMYVRGDIDRIGPKHVFPWEREGGDGG